MSNPKKTKPITSEKKPARRLRKVSDANLLKFLRKSGGIFSATAKLIETKLDVTMTRQAVRERVLKNFQKEWEEIKEETLDIAEYGVLASMRSTNERIKYDACWRYLNQFGKERGYGEVLSVEHKVNPFLDMPPEERAEAIKHVVAQLQMDNLNDSDEA